LKTRNQLSIYLLLLGIAPTAALADSPGAFASFTVIDIGRPANLPPYSAAGLVFNPANSNGLLLGGIADYPSGHVYNVGLTRDPVTQTITGFDGTFSSAASTPYIDGGLSYGPDQYLFFTQYPNNTIGEIKPGDTSPDYTEALPGVTSSTGGLAFIPAGFAGAGNAAISSYSGDSVCSATVNANSDGSFSFGTCTDSVTFGSSPEGLLYVAAGTPGFSTDALVVAFYSQSVIVAYQLDSNGMPVLSTGQTIATVQNPIGLALDPVTNDIVTDSINGSINIIAAPEPGSFTLALVLLLAGSRVQNYYKTTRRNSNV